MFPLLFYFIFFRGPNFFSLCRTKELPPVFILGVSFHQNSNVLDSHLTSLNICALLFHTLGDDFFLIYSEAVGVFLANWTANHYVNVMALRCLSAMIQSSFSSVAVNNNEKKF